jgi:hypothetical protein
VVEEFEFKILPDEIGYMLRKADSVISELEMKIKYGDDYDTEYLEGRDLRDLIRRRSPFQWLAGAYLADDYRVCFGREPTLNRATDGTLRGPFIRFVEHVLDEFDAKNGSRRYSREAIADALTDVRKGRYRRSLASA